MSTTPVPSSRIRDLLTKMPDMTTETIEAQLLREGYATRNTNGFKQLIYNVRSQIKTGKVKTARAVSTRSLPTGTNIGVRSDVLVGTAKFIREHGSETLIEAGRLIKEAGTDLDEYMRLIETIQTVR